MLRRLTLAALLLTVPADAKELRIAMKAAVDSADPHLTYTPNRNVGLHVFEPLVDLDAQLRPIPGLAESWRPLDELTWEFTLREGVRFHDGSAFTAADAVFSIRRAQSITGARTYANAVRNIAEAKARDARTLILRMKRRRRCSRISSRRSPSSPPAPPLAPAPIAGCAGRRGRMWYSTARPAGAARRSRGPAPPSAWSATTTPALPCCSPAMSMSSIPYQPGCSRASHQLQVGTPAQIADRMQEWLEEGACDGFNLMFPHFPRPLEDFCELVVPELQRRGVYRTAYEGRTLREDLGIPVPPNRYARTGANSSGPGTSV